MNSRDKRQLYRIRTHQSRHFARIEADAARVRAERLQAKQIAEQAAKAAIPKRLPSVLSSSRSQAVVK